MAGHSKWKNIQHRKGAQDAKRGKLFTKLIREITQATRLFGADISANPRLRTAIDKALVANMSKDTIENAIKRGSGANDGTQMEELTYEGYGLGGVAIYVECMTDNRNRTVAEIRHAFTKCGGNLGTDGSVAYLFNQKGYFQFIEQINEDVLMEIALEAGAEDIIKKSDGSLELLTTPEQFTFVKNLLNEGKVIFQQAEVTFIPLNTITINDKEMAEKLLKLIDMLEDLDDVQNVYSNADIPDSVITQLS
ncbi:MAG: Transcriptional regulatory protein PmpR [Legionellaceae bacterium]